MKRAIALLSSVAALGVAAAATSEPPGLATAPLAARSAPAGSTLFTRLDPTQTGIVCPNHYADPRMWTERYTEVMNGGLGTGVAVADFDQDGRPDVFVVSKTGASRLFRNEGNWKFSDVTVAAKLATGESLAVTDRPDWTQGAAWADVNNDGWLDLYVCRFNAPNQLWVNQRDGTFKDEAVARGLAVVDASGMGAFFDYDRDGWLDVYVQTSLLDSARAPAGQRDYLFRNRGDGTFEDVTTRAGISGENFAHATLVWDYDDNGWPDLYVANDFDAPDRLYRNQRDGTFRNVIDETVPHLPYSSMGADLGDLNNDGLIDVLTTDMAATTHEKDQRGMAYSRTLKPGTPDEAATAAPQYSRNALFLNSGTGRMLEAAFLTGLAATDWTWSVRFEDFDNDGWLDLHVTNGMLREYQNSDLLTRTTLAENAAERIRLMRASPLLTETNLAFRNRGDLRFEEVGPAWGLNENGISFGAACADFDGDGDLDLVYANHEASPTVMRNDSSDGHRVIIALRGTVSNRFGIGAKVTITTARGRQVRQLVLARGYLSTSEPIVHFGLGDADTVEKLTVEWPNGHRQEFASLPADRRYTVTEPDGATPTPRPTPAAPLFAEVGATFGLDFTTVESFEGENQPLVPFRFDRLGPALALGDVNNDGKDDVLIGGSGRQPAQLLSRDGARFVAGAPLPPSPLDDGPLLLLDADGDGRLDVLQTKSGTNRVYGSPHYQPAFLRNTGTDLTPQPDALPPLPISVGAAVAADFDRDGQPDVFLGARARPGKYPLTARSALLRNTGGRFEDVTDTLAPALREPGAVRAALASDVDRDGWPDLLVALEWGGVRYFRNDAGAGFTDRSAAAGFAAAGTGWWTALASADFNGDGHPDYAVGNIGLNTPYQDRAELYVGAFKPGAATQVIEAHSEQGRLLPRRTRKELGAQLPAILRQFPTNDAYARATLPEIVGADRLAAAQHFVANELQSGVFLSQPDGTYRFQPLPRLAQIAPVQGLAAGDFDGDGFADLYLVQNSFAPNPGPGRFDGGLSLLLRGDGRGRFEPIPPGTSGLQVSGDAKALVVLDLDDDGAPDFLVSRNNASLLAWRNHPAPGKNFFAVTVRNARDHRTLLGTRLELELADGTRQITELTAGSGYLSQGGTTAFFGWPQTNPPKKLRVTWPDGQETGRDFSGTPDKKIVVDRR